MRYISQLDRGSLMCCSALARGCRFESCYIAPIFAVKHKEHRKAAPETHLPMVDSRKDGNQFVTLMHPALPDLNSRAFLLFQICAKITK